MALLVLFFYCTFTTNQLTIYSTREMEHRNNAVSYSDKQIQVSSIAKAIAHPARIAILELLNTRDCTCGDIVRLLPLAQSTISQHLQALKKANLINGIDLPPKTLYHLNKEKYIQSRKMLEKIIE